MDLLTRESDPAFTVSCLSDMSWTRKDRKPRRAGVIPVLSEGDAIYYCFGRDTISHELTDFGGGVTGQETPPEGALRELQEESLGIFGQYTLDELSNQIAICNNKMLIIFLHITNITRVQLYNLFASAVGNILDPEVNGVEFLTPRELIESLKIYHNGKYEIYSVVRRFIHAARGYGLVLDNNACVSAGACEPIIINLNSDSDEASSTS